MIIPFIFQQQLVNNGKQIYIDNYLQLDMSINYQFSSSNLSKQPNINRELKESNKYNLKTTLTASQSPKQSEYVFKVINPAQSKILEKGKLTKELKETDKTNNGIENTQQKAKKIQLQTYTPTNKKSTFLFDKQTKIIPQSIQLLKERINFLQKQSEGLKKQNMNLKDQIAKLNQRLEMLSQEQSGKSIISLQNQNRQLQLQIEKIKDQYVQTSLDCFNEALKGQFQKIIQLKSKLEDQKQKNIELNLLIEEYKLKRQYYQKEIEIKSKIFEVQTKSSKQKFQIKLSDKDNKIKELQNSLHTLGQKYQLCLNQIKFKDEFLYQLKEERERNL